MKNGGDCYCFYDAGYLPPENAFEVVEWESVRGGDAQGEIGGGDGAEGVGCYRVIIRETVSFCCCCCCWACVCFIICSCLSIFDGSKPRRYCYSIPT